MIKAVLFDVDGVLSAHQPFSKRLARDHGITTDITAPFFRGPFRDCLVRKADLKEQLPLYLPLLYLQSETREQTLVCLKNPP